MATYDTCGWKITGIYPFQTTSSASKQMQTKWKPRSLTMGFILLKWRKMGNTRAVSCYRQIAICLYLQATPNRQAVMTYKITILLFYTPFMCNGGLSVLWRIQTPLRVWIETWNTFHVSHQSLKIACRTTYCYNQLKMCHVSICSTPIYWILHYR